MKRFLSGVICGLGGVSPGLSGSVMLVISGYYDKTIEAIGTFFKKPKEHTVFLFPLLLGMGIGVLMFGKVVDNLLDNFEMLTRMTFLGFILGAIPLFYRKVKAKDFKKKHYAFIIIAFLIGLTLMLYNKTKDPFTTLDTFQSIGMGLLLASSTIIPGIDSSVILSSLGLYQVYIKAIANIDLAILVPALAGAGVGVLIFSSLINYFIKNHYTKIYSIILGLFIAMVPSVINKSVVIKFDLTTLLSFILLGIGFTISYRLSLVSVEKE